MTPYHVDFETASRADLRKVGAFKYAECPSTSILLCAVARGNESPFIWDFTDPFSLSSLEAEELLEEAAKPGNLVYAHNAPFEMAISDALWESTFGFAPPPLESYRCTAAMARRAALPSALGDLAKVLKLPQQKDKRGEQLIKIFCVPRSAGKLKGQRILPTDDCEVTVAGEKMHVSEAWKLFREYCVQDVVTEQLIHRTLSAFELKGITLRSFQFDLRMNKRGLPVNVDALRKAEKLVREASAVEIEKFQELTGLNPSQVGKFLTWLKERGYPEDDLREENMSSVLDNPPEDMTTEAVEALRIRSRVSFSAVKKIPSMLNIACKDGRVRGSLMWSGAIRTHRWSGKLIQPQNFKRPPKHLERETGEIYKAICAGWDHEMLGMVWGNPVECGAACIRHFIHDLRCVMYDADYKNIEARIVPWLAGQADLLQAYRDGRDPYSELAAKIYGKPEAIPTPEECAAKDICAYKQRYSIIEKSERFVGKVGILSCGFQTGWLTFQSMCALYGVQLDDQTCKTTIEVYREKNAEVVSMWKAVQRAAVQAIENPGSTFKVRGKLTFGMATKLPFPALIMRLPSGHHLVYPYPELHPVWIFDGGKYSTQGQAEAARRLWKIQREKDKKASRLSEEELAKEEPRIWQTQQITFLGQNSKTHQWGREATWGSRLFENAVQSTAGDFITHGALKAEEESFEIFLLIHDQALASCYDEDKADDFRKALCDLPEWASDFPLEASTDITPYYLKEV